MNLDGDLLEALGFSSSWTEPATCGLDVTRSRERRAMDGPYRRSQRLGVRRRRRLERMLRVLCTVVTCSIADVEGARAAKAAELARASKQRQRERDPEHQRRLAREATRRRRERLKAAGDERWWR